MTDKEICDAFASRRQVMACIEGAMKSCKIVNVTVSSKHSIRPGRCLVQVDAGRKADCRIVSGRMPYLPWFWAADLRPA